MLLRTRTMTRDWVRPSCGFPTSTSPEKLFLGKVRCASPLPLWIWSFAMVELTTILSFSHRATVVKGYSRFWLGIESHPIKVVSCYIFVYSRHAMLKFNEILNINYRLQTQSSPSSVKPASRMRQHMVDNTVILNVTPQYVANVFGWFKKNFYYTKFWSTLLCLIIQRRAYLPTSAPPHCCCFTLFILLLWILSGKFFKDMFYQLLLQIQKSVCSTS